MKSFWKRTVAIVVILGSFGGALAQEGPARTGDAAPALDVQKWVKGDAADLAALKGKSAVLLEFFSCGFERQPAQIKHLNELQAKYAAAGLKVVALATDAPADVERFVADKDIKYSVGIDNMRNSIAAFGASEPPLTALISKDGRLAWRGDVTQVDPFVERLMSGKLDPAHERKTEDLRIEVVRQFATKTPAQIDPPMDALLAHDPNALWLPTNAGQLNVKRWCFVDSKDAKGWREWIAKHVAKMTEAGALNELAWDLVTDGALAWREPSAALAASTKAVELTQSKNAAMIDTLARVYYEIGLPDRAAETQQKAVAALAADASEDEKKQYQETLSYYQTCAALAKTMKPAPKAPDPKKKP